MKEKVYLDSTIPSYIVGKPSGMINIRSWQDISKFWWENERHKYELYISEVVLSEIELGDPVFAQKRKDLLKDIEILENDSEIDHLAGSLMSYFQFPEKLLRDSYHIAFATRYEMDFLLSWNFSHLVNAHMRLQVGRFTRKLGYNPPDICTPEELQDMKFKREEP